MIFLTAGLFLISLLVFLLDRYRCDYAREIKSYATGMSNVYYLGPRYCPAIWSFEKIDKMDLETKSYEGTLNIFSISGNAEIEQVIENKYLGYNKLTAGGGESPFVLYEVNCTSCKK